jgi:hypothetical protein
MPRLSGVYVSRKFVNGCSSEQRGDCLRSEKREHNIPFNCWFSCVFSSRVKSWDRMAAYWSYWVRNWVSPPISPKAVMEEDS